jgi:ABC-2 type transport system ATP-binding protein
MPLIQVDSVTKQFRRRTRREGLRGVLSSLISPETETITAVDRVSFAIEAGEMVGYIGPNGAGKSTTIKMLSGILVPTSGAIDVGGLSPSARRKQHARQIGVVFGQRTSLWWDVPVIDSLGLLRDIYKVPQAQFERNLELFTDLLGLGGFLHVPVRQLSLGQRVLADIAAALLHDPAILFLDEPTIGVDVVSKERLRGFLREINLSRQVTVLLTTHDMDEIEKLCSRVLIIDHGRILYDGTIEDIRARYAAERLLAIELEDAVPDFPLAGAVLKRSQERKKWFTFNRFETSATDLIAAVNQKYPVADLTVTEPEIEDVIRLIYLDQAERMNSPSPPAPVE